VATPQIALPGLTDDDVQAILQGARGTYQNAPVVTPPALSPVSSTASDSTPATTPAVTPPATDPEGAGSRLWNALTRTPSFIRKPLSAAADWLNEQNTDPDHPVLNALRGFAAGALGGVDKAAAPDLLQPFTGGVSGELSPANVAMLASGPLGKALGLSKAVMGAATAGAAIPGLVTGIKQAVDAPTTGGKVLGVSDAALSAAMMYLGGYDALGEPTGTAAASSGANPPTTRLPMDAEGRVYSVPPKGQPAPNGGEVGNAPYQPQGIAPRPAGDLLADVTANSNTPHRAPIFFPEAEDTLGAESGPVQTTTPERLEPPTHDAAGNPIFDDIDALQQHLGLSGSADQFDLAPEGPTTTNASGAPGGGSMEELNRTASMRQNGQTFGVYDRAGNFRNLGNDPGVQDYVARPGETFGVQSPTGFSIFDDRGGYVPDAAKASPVPVSPQPTNGPSAGPGTVDLGDLGEAGAGAGTSTSPDVDPLIQALHESLVPKWKASVAAQAGTGGPVVDPSESLADFNARLQRNAANPRQLMGAERKVMAQIQARGVQPSSEPVGRPNDTATPTLAPGEAPPPPPPAIRDSQAGGTEPPPEAPPFVPPPGEPEPDDIDAALEAMHGESGAIDPKLAIRLGLIGTGAVGGSVADPNHPVMGALLGGGVGALAGAGIPGAGGDPGVLRSYRYLNMLLSPTVGVAKTAGDAGMAANLALEYASRGDLETAGSILKRVYSPQTVKDILTNIKNGPPAEPSPVGGWVPNETPTTGHPAVDAVLNTPRNVLGGVTEGVQAAYRELGLPEEEIEKATAMAPPSTAPTRMLAGAVNAPDAGEVADWAFPFTRVASNYFDRGVENLPGVRLGQAALNAVRGNPAGWGSAAVMTVPALAAAAHGAYEGEQEQATGKPTSYLGSRALEAGEGPYMLSDEMGRAVDKAYGSWERSKAGHAFNAPDAIGHALIDALPLPSEEDVMPSHLVTQLAPGASLAGGVSRMLGMDPKSYDQSGFWGPTLAQYPFVNDATLPKSRTYRPPPGAFTSGGRTLSADDVSAILAGARSGGQ
jgi:hypothetical protein